jgi:hypothetical protein
MPDKNFLVTPKLRLRIKGCLFETGKDKSSNYRMEVKTVLKIAIRKSIYLHDAANVESLHGHAVGWRHGGNKSWPRGIK